MDVTWILLVVAAGLAGAGTGLYIGSWVLRRTVRELQYGLAALEEQLYREVKKRAAATRWEPDEKPADPATLKNELKTGFLSPGEFARRKSERRMGRGSETGETV